MTMGGEQRIFFNNFFQPPNPTGLFDFSDTVTSPFPGSDTDALNNPTGNPFATLLFGYPDNGSVINIYPAVANKSKETGFYFQDNWKVTSKLTVNLGMRYEWSTPYTERFNRIEFSDFTGNSGMSIDLTAGGQNQALGLGTKNLIGTTLFPNTFGSRSVPVDRNNWGPRLGFCVSVRAEHSTPRRCRRLLRNECGDELPVSRHGVPQKRDHVFHHDNFNTRAATLANPFPNGLTGPQNQIVRKTGRVGLCERQ